MALLEPYRFFPYQTPKKYQKKRPKSYDAVSFYLDELGLAQNQSPQQKQKHFFNNSSPFSLSLNPRPVYSNNNNQKQKRTFNKIRLAIISDADENQLPITDSYKISNIIQSEDQYINKFSQFDYQKPNRVILIPKQSTERKSEPKFARSNMNFPSTTKNEKKQSDILIIKSKKSNDVGFQVPLIQDCRPHSTQHQGIRLRLPKQKHRPNSSESMILKFEKLLTKLDLTKQFQDVQSIVKNLHRVKRKTKQTVRFGDDLLK